MSTCYITLTGKTIGTVTRASKGATASTGPPRPGRRNWSAQPESRACFPPRQSPQTAPQRSPLPHLTTAVQLLAAAQDVNDGEAQPPNSASGPHS